MTKEEIINSIKSIYSSLNNQLSSSALLSSANRILDLLYKLKEIDPEFLGFEIDNLQETIDREIMYASESEKKMRMKSAPKSRQDEFNLDMNKAINQIRNDLFSILS